LPAHLRLTRSRHWDILAVAMLIIPLTGKISRKNPPVVTIAIILINCFVFFVLQAGDTKRYCEATEFYLDSDLARIEVSAYLDYVRTTKGIKRDLPPQKKGLDERTVMRLSMKMQSDEAFMERLLNDEIITPGDETYSTWKSLRTQYEGKLNRMVIFRYGFKPAKWSVLTAFTHMFIHGSFGHILGNMIFLWLVGCVLELGCGRVVYVAIYIISGMLAVGLFCLVYMHSRAPLIGASGAIAGLMGAYTVLYGRKRIKVFYSLGFYFNYTRVPAIILLPIWIGNEFFQLFWGGQSQIAYVAHIGGLISGASLGYLNLRILGRADEELFAEDPKEHIPAMLEKALQQVAELDMGGARSVLEEVLEIDPDNQSALTHLFNIEKLDPGGKRFNDTASRLLLRLSQDSDNCEALRNTFTEYCRISMRPKLSPGLLLRIGSVFSAHGHLEQAEKIMAVLLRGDHGLKELPAGLLNLAHAYFNKGMTDKGQKCLRIICQRYPESSQCLVARSLLKGSG
jgi:membrane associated rhomboid family serine protease